MKPTPTPEMIERIAKIIDKSAWQAIEDGRNALPHSLWGVRRDGARHTAAEVIAALSVPAAAVVGEPVVVPVPRGGLEPNWWEEWQKIVRKYRRLEKAARFVVSETDRIHDNKPWPLKYQAPYEAITQLRDVLSAAPSAPEGWQPIETAPRDAVILLYGRIDPNIEFDRLVWKNPSVFSGCWDTIDDAWVPSGGTWEGPFMQVTHWRPLPAPPALGGASHD